MKKTVVIIGGGASGFFCAANLDTRKMRTIILEKTGKVLSKVKVSGGGRCNVTNGKYDTVPEFAAQYPRGQNLLKKTLHHFSYADTIHWFRSRNVLLKMEEDGRVFPVSNQSQTIIDCLEGACKDQHVEVRLNAAAKRIEYGGGAFKVHTEKEIIEADIVCVATGGLSKPEQYQWLNRIGVGWTDPVPSLFTFNLPRHPVTNLMGVSAPDVLIRIQGEKLSASGPMLITHWGLSGPAVLRLSAWGARLLAEKNWNFRTMVNWLGIQNEEEARADFYRRRAAKGKALLSSKNPFGLPARLWEYLLEESGMDTGSSWADLSSKNQNRLIHLLTQYEFEVKGKTTFKEEFVTAGGVPLNEISSGSMMHKHIPGLYVIGEALDVDGITGGFNFQHAWSSAYIAAQHMLKSTND